MSPSTEISKPKPRETAFLTLERVRIKMDNTCQRWLVSILPSQMGPPLRRIFVMTGGRIKDLTLIAHLGPLGYETLKCNTRYRGPRRCVSPLTDSGTGQLTSGLPRLVSHDPLAGVQV